MTNQTKQAVISNLLEEDVDELYENAPCGYLSTLPDGTLVKVNQIFLNWTARKREDLLFKKRFQDLLSVAGKIYYDTHFAPLLLMQGFIKELAFDIISEDGSRIPILLNSTLKRDPSGNPLVIRITMLDARRRRAYEEELRLAQRKAEEAQEKAQKLADELESLANLRTRERDRLWRISQDILVVGSLEGGFISCNPAFIETLGWSDKDLEKLTFVQLAHPNQMPSLDTALKQLALGQPVNRLELPLRHQDGSYRIISWTITPEGTQIYAVGRDITDERMQAESLRKVEEALRQAQKMDAIGKLTGGVAHDFNNILQVIGANLELLRVISGEDERAHKRVNNAISAVYKGSSLTSQLLAFARRQPLQPVSTHLGHIVQDMGDMLSRTLGERIEIETVVGAGLWTAMVDRNQLQNAILNLAINARDAMNGAGKLTLEVSNASLDDYYARIHSEVTAGQYVMLAVTDTGSGMTPDIMEKIFDPFFTTKPGGKGTGLGLSMVYGFVKQSGGHIKIYSEHGNGTTFKIYLPRIHQEELVSSSNETKESRGGTETILVVEDDMAVQEAVADMLTCLGYKVLKADEAQSALGILQSGMAIDLLFTDVVMPGALSSPELVKQATLMFPNLKVLFTSGYTQNAIDHGGKLDSGVELLSKPYSQADLAKKIRSLLEQK